MLCNDCERFRFPETFSSSARSTSDNANNADLMLNAGAPTDATSMPTKTVIKCELLCFLQEKSAVMTADHIVKLFADFYSKYEITEARNLLDQHVPQRLPRRKGTEFSRLTVQDLLKSCVEPNAALPDFFPKSIDRLPSVDITHCDVSAIMKELQALRSEVRHSSESWAEFETTTANELHLLRAEALELKVLRNELTLLRSEVVEIKQLREEVVTLKDIVNKLQHSEARKLKDVRDEVAAA